MKKTIIAVLFFGFALSLLGADTGKVIMATTDDGRKVLLLPDGTWKWADVNPVAPKEELKTQDNPSQTDFRDTKWGMSNAEVKKIEKENFFKEEGNFLGYKGEVGGKDCQIIYTFVQDKLVRAEYIITEKHTNQNDYISDYNSLKELLTKKYGKPTKDEEFWRNDLYKDDYSHWGFAVSLGHHAYFTTWETPSTEILEFLHGDNYQITLGIGYTSKQFEDLEKKTKEEEEKKKI